MTVSPAVALLLPALVGLLVGTLSGPVLRRLPEPRAGVRGATADDVAAKTPYADLAVPRFRLGCALLAGAGTVLVVASTPVHAWPTWLVLATVGVLAAAIDARTTWLPARLTWAGWGLVVLSAPAGLLLDATASDLLRVLSGAAVAGALFWAVWRVSGGQLAFGDVRLAPLLGAAGGSVSWPAVLLVLLAGTVAGAVHGLVRTLRRRPGPFPYAPALVTGAFVAPLLWLLR